ncbi:MAG: hypothetical protein WAM91_00570 [Candidatus Acidiferrales bacterium]
MPVQKIVHNAIIAERRGQKEAPPISTNGPRLRLKLSVIEPILDRNRHISVFVRMRVQYGSCVNPSTHEMTVRLTVVARLAIQR